MAPVAPYPGHADVAIRAAMTDAPVVVLQDARQVGKSTLAGVVASPERNPLFVTLDDEVTRSAAAADPNSSSVGPVTACSLSTRRSVYRA